MGDRRDLRRPASSLPSQFSLKAEPLEEPDV